MWKISESKEAKGNDQIRYSEQKLQQNIDESIKFIKVPPILIPQSSENNKEHNIYNKVIHSPPVLRRKSKSTSPEEYSSYKKHIDGKNTINVKSKSITSKKHSISNISPQSSNNKVNESKNKMEYISFESTASESRSSCSHETLVRIFLLILHILL